MMNKVCYQWQLFLLALSFFSRIPVPASLPYSEERMNQAGRYFAVVGLLLGAWCAALIWLLQFGLPTHVAILLTMVFSLLLTGAFHEDGLTDMADGIGGGMTIERRLTIMKDSRIGTYGASALVMALLGKFVLLVELAELNMVIMSLIIAYTVSRTVAATLIYDTPYVSELDSSKSKPLAQRQTSLELSILIVSGVLPCLFLDLGLAISLIAFVLLFRSLFRRWLLARIGGFTGDCLGAAQQLSELGIYIVFIAWQSNQL